MALVDRNLADVFRHRIIRACGIIENDNEAQEIIRQCTSIENSAKALRKIAKEEIDNEPND